MNIIDIQGSAYERLVSSLIQLTISSIKSRYSESEPAQTEACIRDLEDFLWDFSGLATSDGSQEECDEFISQTQVLFRRDLEE